MLKRVNGICSDILQYMFIDYFPITLVVILLGIIALLAFFASGGG